MSYRIVSLSFAGRSGQVRGRDEELPSVLRRTALRRRQAVRRGRRPGRRRPHHLLPRVEGRRLHLGAVHVLQLRRVALLQRLPSSAAPAAAARPALAAYRAAHGHREADRVGRVAGASAAVHARLGGAGRLRRRGGVAETERRVGTGATTEVEVAGDEQRTESTPVCVARQTGRRERSADREISVSI